MCAKKKRPRFRSGRLSSSRAELHVPTLPLGVAVRHPHRRTGHLRPGGGKRVNASRPEGPHAKPRARSRCTIARNVPCDDGAVATRAGRAEDAMLCDCPPESIFRPTTRQRYVRRRALRRHLCTVLYRTLGHFRASVPTSSARFARNKRPADCQQTL